MRFMNVLTISTSTADIASKTFSRIARWICATQGVSIELAAKGCIAIARKTGKGLISCANVEHFLGVVGECSTSGTVQLQRARQPPKVFAATHHIGNCDMYHVIGGYLGNSRTQILFWRTMALCLALLMAGSHARADAPDAVFEERVRAYILANPEVILEALEILSTREARAAQTAQIARHPDLFTDPTVLEFGPPDADVTVVEFFDYRCAPCKALHPKLKTALEAHPNVRVVMRQLPILSPGSERGARFALAVNSIAGPENYRAVHDVLWTLKGPLRDHVFAQIAADHNLDWPAVQAEMNSDAVTQRISRNRDIAIDLDILGTPAFVTPWSVSFGGTDAQALVDAWVSR